MRISDWSSDVCSSDLELCAGLCPAHPAVAILQRLAAFDAEAVNHAGAGEPVVARGIRGESRVGAVAQIADGTRSRDGAIEGSRIPRMFSVPQRVTDGQKGVRGETGRTQGSGRLRQD